MNQNKTSATVRACEKVMLEKIKEIESQHGVHDANCYVFGIMRGVGQYWADKYGSRAAYNCMAGYADDWLLPELPK